MRPACAGPLPHDAVTIARPGASRDAARAALTAAGAVGACRAGGTCERADTANTRPRHSAHTNAMTKRRTSVVPFATDRDVARADRARVVHDAVRAALRLERLHPAPRVAAIVDEDVA